MNSGSRVNTFPEGLHVHVQGKQKQKHRHKQANNNKMNQGWSYLLVVNDQGLKLNLTDNG